MISNCKLNRIRNRSYFRLLYGITLGALASNYAQAGFFIVISENRPSPLIFSSGIIYFMAFFVSPRLKGLEILQVYSFLLS